MRRGGNNAFVLFSPSLFSFLRTFILLLFYFCIIYHLYFLFFIFLPFISTSPPPLSPHFLLFLSVLPFLLLPGRYGDAVKELDAAVGTILHALKVKQVENNTLVVFTSDNGAALVSKEEGEEGDSSSSSSSNSSNGYCLYICWCCFNNM